MPEQTVTTAGEKEGHSDLGVELNQPARKPGDVQKAILELSRAVEVLAILKFVLDFGDAKSVLKALTLRPGTTAARFFCQQLALLS